MKGQYRTKDGSKVEVVDFDEANKMVRINERWVGEPEYSEWESLENEPAVSLEEPSEELSNEESEPETKAKKPAKKKKDDSAN